MAVDQLNSLIQKGRKGKNIGISTGCTKLDAVINGIQKKYMYVVAADQGSGKSSYALDIFVYNLIKNKGDKDVNILYYSFEMSSEVLYAKILSLYLFDTFDKVISYKTILSLNEIISDDDYNCVEKGLEWLRTIEKSFTIYDNALTPAGIYATCKSWLKEYGEFFEIKEHKEDYREYDSNSYKVVIIDHISLIAGPDSKKAKIDTVCDYMIHFRNKCNITSVIIQQTNRNSKSMERKNSGYELLQLDDLQDSSATSQAAEVVIMLYNPFREKIARCEGYPISNVLKDRFRLVQIVKNRFGLSDKNVGNTFFGEIGLFKELPRPDEIIDYDDYLTLSSNHKTINKFKS